MSRHSKRIIIIIVLEKSSWFYGKIYYNNKWITLLRYKHYMTSVINILVNKLWKTQWKIIDNSYISQLLEKIIDEPFSEAKVYKMTHNLKNKGYLISLKKNCFLISHPNKKIDEDEITINYYRELLRKHCQTYLTWNRYIGGLKALEFHLQNYEAPDTIDIVNTKKNALEVVLFEKTLAYKRYTHKQNDIFWKVKKYLINQKIGKYSFPIAPLELAMLESLHNPSQIQIALINEYTKKLIRKHKKSLDYWFFEMILLHNKHHVWVNRIYQLSKSIDPVVAEKLHTILKKYSFVIQP